MLTYATLPAETVYVSVGVSQLSPEIVWYGYKKYRGLVDIPFEVTG